MKLARKKTLIPKILDDNDETITSRTGIANVLVKFYSKLYANESQDEDTCIEGEVTMANKAKSKEKRSIEKEADQKGNESEKTNEESESIPGSTKEKNEILPEFTEQEVQAAIDSLKQRQIWRQQANQSRRH